MSREQARGATRRCQWISTVDRCMTIRTWESWKRNDEERGKKRERVYGLVDVRMHRLVHMDVCMRTRTDVQVCICMRGGVMTLRT